MTEKGKVVSKQEALAAASRALPQMSVASPNPLPRPGMTSGAQASLVEPVTTAELRERQTDRIKVQATQMGYYDHTRRRAGDVFTIRNDEEFSERWMRRVAADTPEHTTLSNEAIRRHHDETLAGRIAGKGESAATGDQDVL